VVPGRRGAGVGERADVRRLAGADRLRRRRRDARRRHRRRRRRRGRRPADLVADVVATAVEQERLEGWIMREVEAGVALPGLYPSDAATRARYEAWARREDAKR
jgi:hypothetical protein